MIEVGPQVIRALGGKRTHCMANLKKNFTDEIQVVGKDISLVLLVQVSWQLLFLVQLLLWSSFWSETNLASNSVTLGS